MHPPFPRGPARRALLALLLTLACLLAAPPSQAQQHRAAGHQAPALTSDDIDHLSSVLQDSVRRAEFLRTLEALKAANQARGGGAAEGAAPDPATGRPAASGTATAPGAATAATAAPEVEAPAPAAAAAPAPAAAAGAAPAAPATPAEPIIAPNTTGALVLQWMAGLQDRLGPVSRELLAAARSMADLPGVWRSLQGLADNPVARARAIEASWVLLLLACSSLLAEHLLWRALAGARQRLDALAPPERKRWAWLRRLALLVARLVLDLLPIAAFLGMTHLLLGLLQPLPTTRAIALRASGIYVVARAVFALVRLLLAPASHRLRLVPISDRAARRALRWLRRLLWVGLGGYALAEAGIALGLSWAAYDALINVTLLICSLQLTYMVIRSREAVATVLRAPPIAPGSPPPDRARRMLRSVRNGAAGIWHILTILWLLAAWVVWALAIEDGISRLLTSTLLLVAIGIVAKAVDEGLAHGLERMVTPGGAAAAANGRTATLAPVLRTLATILVVIGGLFVLFWIWGFDIVSWFVPGTLGNRLLGTFASIGTTFIAAALVWEVANAAIARRLTRLARESGQSAARSARIRTLLPMLRTVLSILIIVFLALSTLSELGVNVAPLLAGAGVVGLAIGFGSQTLVRDVITGVFLLLEDAVAVGDVVSLAGLSGVVENLSIRSIKLRATDGSVHIIPFSAVTTVTNMTRDFGFAVVDVTVNYDADPDQVTEVLQEISTEMRADAKFGAMIRDDIDVWGVDKMSDQGVTIRSRIKTGPSSRWPVQRELNRRIRNRFAALGIQMVKPGQMLVLSQPDAVRNANPVTDPKPRAAE